MLPLITHKKLRFFLLLFLTPIFWWILFQTSDVVSEWAKAPQYFERKTKSIFSIERLRYIIESRWATHEQARKDPFARLFYNKATLLVDEFFDFTTYLTPRLYFQAGDGSNLSPPGIEPIPAILFPFWIFGIFSLFHQKRLRVILIFFILGILAYFVGQKNFNFLFPIVLTNVYLVNEGIETIREPKKKAAVFALLLLYSTYILGRSIWLTE